MEKYKICPSCKTKNPPALFECMNCEADLTGVKITDEETERMLAENTAAQAEATPKRWLECVSAERKMHLMPESAILVMKIYLILLLRSILRKKKRKPFPLC